MHTFMQENYARNVLNRKCRFKTPARTTFQRIALRQPQNDCRVILINSKDIHVIPGHSYTVNTAQTAPADGRTGADNRVRNLSVAIPVVSFGGILIAIGLESLGIIGNAGEFGGGCVIGSFLLSYLAYILPRRDIVSLLAPIYAFLIFIMPLEMPPNLILQVLYASTLTVLVVRLNKRFNTPVTKEREEDSMEKILYDYIRRLTPLFGFVDTATAHEVASVVLSFKFALYSNTIRSADKALASLPDTKEGSALKTALRIVRDRAENLETMKVTDFSKTTFPDDQKEFLAVVLPPGTVEGLATLALNNALLLIYAVAYLESPDDGQALDEHQNYVIQILSTYENDLKK